MVDKEKIREIINDPVKLDQHLRRIFDEMDKDKKGYVDFETVHKTVEAKLLKIGKEVHESDHKPGDLDKAKAIACPNNDDKVTYDGFKTLMLAGLKHHREHAKK